MEVDEYKIPKGALILPSIWESSFQGYTNPHEFDPERFSQERREFETCRNNFLVFGTGAHLCLGKEYAKNQVCLFTALLAATSLSYKTRRDEEIIFCERRCCLRRW